MITDNALYIVATPIGNLADISQRALEVLAAVDLIAAEDTRHSAKLLQHYHISTPMVAYHDHSNENQTRRLLKKLQAGGSIALISDAGTPLISDPGFKLVREARHQDFQVVPIPGPCALITGLSGSGLPSDRFIFEGFPPAKSGARKSAFELLANEKRTLIYYESPHRILESLTDMMEIFGGDRQVVLARELTKNFEIFLSGSLENILQQLHADPNQQKGEMVIMLHGALIDPNATDISVEAQHTVTLLMTELPLKKAAALTAQITGEKKNKIYQWACTKGKSGDNEES